MRTHAPAEVYAFPDVRVGCSCCVSILHSRPGPDGHRSCSRPCGAEADRGRGSGRGWHQPSHRRVRYDDRCHRRRQRRHHRREARVRARDHIRAGGRRRDARGHRGVATATEPRGKRHRRRIDADRQASRGSAHARRGPRARGNRREDAHDARRHRHDAERNGRHAGADDVAVARRRQRAHSGHARPVYARALGRAAAVWRGRRARSAPDPADGSGTGRGHQRCGLGVIWRRRDGWRHQPAVAASRR